MYGTSIDWQTIASHIGLVIGQPFEMQNCYSIGGGQINSNYRIEGAGQSYFVKINQPHCFEIFAAEAAGLAELAQPAVIKVPVPLCWGTTYHHAYLVMEYITLRNDSQVSSEKLGHQLAVLHQVVKIPYGWYRNNYLGPVEQVNALTKEWIDFWRTNRLNYQLELAARKGYTGTLQGYGEQLSAHIHLFFSDYRPLSSLLHGDLWAGNYGIDTQNQPVLFDPAVYYGDREVDIAMTELVGGFPNRFYQAYQDTFPLDPGYAVRKKLYNLYYILNNLNTFGGGYLRQAEGMMLGLLSELR